MNNMEHSTFTLTASLKSGTNIFSHCDDRWFKRLNVSTPRYTILSQLWLIVTNVHLCSPPCATIQKHTVYLSLPKYVLLHAACVYLDMLLHHNTVL